MNKGNYYKYKTKKWFEGKGYTADYLEKTMRIYSKGQLINVKKDLFASDILAFNKDELIFAQVKGAKKTTGVNIKKAIEEFNKYPFPPFVKKLIIVWKEKQREPDIIDLSEVEKK